MNNSELCRAAMPNVANSIGICGAVYVTSSLHYGEAAKKAMEILNFLGISASDFVDGVFLLESSPKSYTTRIMLLELAAILYEEEGE